MIETVNSRVEYWQSSFSDSLSIVEYQPAFRPVIGFEFDDKVVHPHGEEEVAENVSGLDRRQLIDVTEKNDLAKVTVVDHDVDQSIEELKVNFST